MNIKWLNKKAILFFVLIGIWMDGNAQTKTIFTIGDSTMSDKEKPKKNPERGWAQMLYELLPQNINVKNHAVNGRSTRSFINEGRWDVVLRDICAGDYVFIQFGHNDQKSNDPQRFTNPYTAYRNNLIKFVLDSRNAGAIPILFTSIVRRKFNDYGTLIDTHGEYPQIARLVANEYDVPLIDLQYFTEKLEESYGVEGSKKLHLHYEVGEHPYYPKGKQDDTHLSELGARTIAEMVVAEMIRLKFINTNTPGE
jgi:lysophospholipase L1-like esterase